MEIKVLYEDNHIIAVFKQAGLPSEPNRPGELSLFSEVKKYLKEKYKKPGNVFLGLVHRLDRPVSGIMLFGKTSKGSSRLSEQMRSGEIKKTYTALVSGIFKEKKGSLKNYLLKDRAKNKSSVSLSPDSGGKLSELSYEVIKENKNRSLLKINLKTGRSHQIRASLSALGHPILGDQKYGSKEKMPDGLIALSATAIEFLTATTKEKIKLSVPASFLF
ncbi:MAG: RNA pseudouridine synthase [Candidatus Paceibacterota bacterium]